MLIGLDPLLTPDLLHALASMGHGDEIAIVDANFPAAACARRLVSLDAAGAPEVLRAVLSVMPLDHAVAHPARVMQVIGAPEEVPEAVRDFAGVLGRALGHPFAPRSIDRQQFYDEARRAFAIVRSGERRFYGNILLAKGVVDAAGRAPRLPGA
ncbi:MAG: RbsD/FucU family protein [Alphaproteobacteria bacterium]|jgi:L-fucose mutarotase